MTPSGSLAAWSSNGWSGRCGHGIGPRYQDLVGLERASAAIHDAAVETTTRSRHELAVWADDDEPFPGWTLRDAVRRLERRKAGVR